MGSALPVLMYHHVSPSPGLVTVAPQTFRQHIERISRDGWKTVGSAELERFFAGEPLPEKSLVITFDDGYLDNFVHAHPVLEACGQKAVLFIVTGWVGDGPARREALCPDHGECKRRIAGGDADSVIVRWSEIEAMRKAGTFEFHSHTHSHTRWDKTLPDGEQRLAALAGDLEKSRSTLRSRLGIESRHLCWPQGYFQSDYVPLAATLGFDHLYTTRPSVNPLSGDARNIGRVVTKEKGGGWLALRLRLYSSSLLGGLYGRMKERS